MKRNVIELYVTHQSSSKTTNKLEPDSMGIKKKIMKIKKDSVTGLEGKTIVLEQSKE